MGFKKGYWASVWEIKPSSSGKSTSVRLSTRKKVGENEYKQDFGRYCLFVGEAHAKAAGLKEKDRIRIGDCEVTNEYSTEKNRELLTFLVYDFELDEETATPSNKTDSKPKGSVKKTAFDNFDDIDGLLDEDTPF